MSTRFAFNFSTPLPPSLLLCVCMCVLCSLSVRVEQSAAHWHLLLLYYLHRNYMESHRRAPKQTPLAPRLHGVSLPHSTTPPVLFISLFVSYANTRNIFQMLFAFALNTILCQHSPCVRLPAYAFSHFSIFHVRFVVVADDTTHTLAHTHMPHTTLVYAALLLTFSLFFLCVILFFLLVFVQQFSLGSLSFSLAAREPLAKRKLSSITERLLPSPYSPGNKSQRLCLPPSVCILNYPWANGLCVAPAVPAPAPAAIPTSCRCPSSTSWLLGFCVSAEHT